MVGKLAWGIDEGRGGGGVIDNGNREFIIIITKLDASHVSTDRGYARSHGLWTKPAASA